ncbi:hypothetical protein [Xenorhabdus bovienii]|nr:hypothetical protein [Xenorhabdus bovienii]
MAQCWRMAFARISGDAVQLRNHRISHSVPATPLMLALSVFAS